MVPQHFTPGAKGILRRLFIPAFKFCDFGNGVFCLSISQRFCWGIIDYSAREERMRDKQEIGLLI